MHSIYLFFFFFFQAEDGIRDLTVTGVQTCALPISVRYNLSCLACRLSGRVYLVASSTCYSTCSLALQPDGPGGWGSPECCPGIQRPRRRARASHARAAGPDAERHAVAPQ